MLIKVQNILYTRKVDHGGAIRYMASRSGLQSRNATPIACQNVCTASDLAQINSILDFECSEKIKSGSIVVLLNFAGRLASQHSRSASILSLKQN